MQTNKAPTFWWQKEDDHEAAKDMFTLAQQLKDEQNGRDTDLRYWLSLYLNRNLAALGGRDALAIVRNSGESDRLTLNLAESCVDTVANRLELNKPKPFYATSGGTWDEKQRAKATNKWLDGLFYECSIHDEITPATRLDALWAGDGVAKVVEGEKSITVERVHPRDLVVDPGEAQMGKPRSIYQDAIVSRSVLMEMFASEDEEADQKIKTLILQAAGPDTKGEAQTRADLVVVREGWHLRSGENAKDGRHIIAVSTGCLNVAESKDDDGTKWEDDEFPFEVLPYKKRPMGFWGCGLVEELSGIQRELTYTAQKIQKMLKLNTSRTFMRRQARIPKSTVTNESGNLIEVDDPTDLKTVADNAVPPEFFAHLDWLWERGFQKAGVSMLSATAKKPAGIDSAVGLREYNDTTNERFAKFMSNDEKFHVRLGRKMVKAAKRVAKRNGGHYKVRLPAKGKVEYLDFKDVEIDEKKNVLMCLPISALPTNPAYRKQEVQEWIAAGWVDQERALDLLNFPDLDDSKSLATAGLHDIEATVSAILTDGRFTDPEPYQNLQLGLKMVTSAYLKARLDGAPEDRLQMLREWLDKATAMVNPPAPPAAPAMPMDPAAAMAGGMPPAGPAAPAMPMPTVPM